MNRYIVSMHKVNIILLCINNFFFVKKNNNLFLMFYIFILFKDGNNLSNITVGNPVFRLINQLNYFIPNPKKNIFKPFLTFALCFWINNLLQMLVYFCNSDL